MNGIFTGKDLIDAGIRQGRWFGRALAAANAVIEGGGSAEAALSAARDHVPAPYLGLQAAGATPIHSNIEAETRDETANLQAVTGTMTEVMRTPMVRAGAIMPYACPAGPRARSRLAGLSPPWASIPECTRPTSAARWRSRFFPGIAPAALLDAVHSVHPLRT
jgi:tRNA-splicing ligase RtcB (3'-phosphate/5'-hydroxy nucleic acid ligase)